MNGQGSPTRIPVASWQGIAFAAVISILFVAQSLAGEAETGTRVRFTFGGEPNAIWKGRIDFAEGSNVRNLKILGMKRDHAGKIYLAGNSLVIDLVHPTEFGGVEFELDGDSSSIFRYALQYRPAGSAPGEPVTLNDQVTLGSLVSGTHSKASTDSRNRVFVHRAPGDDLKFVFGEKSLVFELGHKIEFKLAIGPFCDVDLTEDKTLEVKIVPAGDSEPVATEQLKVNNRIRSKRFQFAVPNPGVYELKVALLEPSRVPFKAPSRLRQRVIQFVVVDKKPIYPIANTVENLELIYENEAGQPVQLPRSRFKPWDKFNSSAKKLIFKHIPKGLGGQSKEYFEVAPGAIQIFPLTVASAQKHLKLEIDYQNAENQLCDFVLFDRESDRQPYSELVSATTKSDDLLSKGLTRSQSLLTWNRSRNPVLMIRNLRSAAPLQIRRIRLYEIKNETRGYRFSTNQTRRIYTQISMEEVSRILSPPRTPETADYSLDDWNTFRLGGRRLIQLIKSAQFHGAMIDVNQNGSAIYPSDLIQFTPALDTGAFASSGRDPIRKDVLELLFRQFDANGLTLIPRFELPEFLAKIEAADDTFRKDIRLKNFEGSDSLTYNYLNPHVQELIQQVILELVNRYSHHDSYGGIALKIGANDQLILNKMTGFNESLISEFLNQNPTRFASATTLDQKRSLILSTYANEFADWHASKTTFFLVNLNSKVQAASKRNLLLDFTHIISSKTGKVEFFPRLRTTTSSAKHFRSRGFDLQQLSESGLVPLMPTLIESSPKLAEQRAEYALKNGLVEFGETTKGTGVMRVVVPRREAANQKMERTDFENVAYHASAPNSNWQFRKDLVTQVCKHDASFVLDSFEINARALSDGSNRVWETYSRLPNVSFDDVTKNNVDSPVVVRKKTIGDQSYFYIGNQSPWPARITVDFSTPLANPRTLRGTFFSKLTKTDSGTTLVIELQPYDLVGGVSDQKALEISDVRFSLPKTLKATLNQRKDQLLAQIRFLSPPESIVANVNPSFEHVGVQETPAAWSFAKDEFFSLRSLADGAAPQGRRVLEITNSESKQWGWIRSPYLANQGTGRISVLVSMKTGVDGKAPRIRLSVDGNIDGREYYRFGSFSVDDDQPLPARLEKKWKVFAVHFNDVPTDLKDLRVGLDVFGSGTVYVDDFKVFDRWFDSQDKDALTKLISLAAHNITDGNFLKAHRIMNGYWPTFLGEAASANRVEQRPVSGADSELMPRQDPNQDTRLEKSPGQNDSIRDESSSNAASDAPDEPVADQKE